MNLGDISKVNEKELSNFDMMIWGFPCTDISIAGKQMGFKDENGDLTRSGLYYEGIRILIEKKPKISLIENVKNLTSKKFKKEFETILNDLDSAGYNTYYKVLNSKDYLIPQNRERVFILSIRKDVDNGKFTFPKPMQLKLKLKDLLENNVDEKYFLTEEQIKRIQTITYITGKRRIQRKDWCDTLCARDWKDPKCVEVFDFRYDEGIRPRKECISPALTTKAGSTSLSGQPLISIGADGIYTNCSQEFQKQPLHDLSRILKANNHDSGVVITQHENVSDSQSKTVVRKLTPEECWRLQGFNDRSFEKAKNSLNETYHNGLDKSNTQLYKQAGNSITTTVPYYILLELYKVMPYLFDDLKLLSLFSGIGAIEFALDRLYKNVINKEVNKKTIYE